MLRSVRTPRLAIAVLVNCLAGAAHAQTATAHGDWSDPAIWNPATVPDDFTATATLDKPSGFGFIVTVGGSFDLLGLVATGSNVNDGPALSGGTLNFAAAGASITVDAVDLGTVFNFPVTFNLNGPTPITINNATFEVRAAIIQGPGAATVAGNGTLLLLGGGNLQTTGATTVSAGAQLQVGDGFSNGTIVATDIVNNGAVLFNQNLASTYGGVISGTGGVTQSSSTLTLSGANTYTGGTSITGGTLVVSADNNLGDAAGALTFDGGALQWGAGFNLAGTRAIALNAGGGTFDTVGFTTTVSQGMTGAGALTAAGGTLILTGDNTYAGGTTVSAGNLRIGNGGTTGSVSGNVTNTGVLIFDRSDALSFGGDISGTGHVQFAGGGTFTLTGASTYTGGTTINAGTLLVNGSLISPVTVNAGATLGGSGSTTGAVTVAGGASLAPGISAGTLATGNLVLNGTSTLDFELDTPGVVGGGVNDLIAVTGDLTLDGALAITDLGNFGIGNYTLMTYTGALTDNGLDLPAPPVGLTYNLTAGGGQVILDVVAVHTLTYSAGANGSLTGTTAQTVDHGNDGTTVEAVPDTGYHFTQWSDDSTDNPRTDTNVTADIGVSASFAINTHSIGGMVSGLSGSGLVLQLNDGDDLAVAADGAFTFSTPLELGAAYQVTVAAQPGDPAQTCTVANGSGTLSDADVTDVQVTCATDTFTVGGTVSGLEGSGLVLQNNGSDDLPITAAGAFTFPTELTDGSDYAVTVISQPTNPIQTCTVANGSGTLSDADVTDVTVTCETAPALTEASVPAATGTGPITLAIDGGGPTCTIAELAATTPEAVAGGGPPGMAFPHGLVDLRLDDCTPGGTVTLTLAFPAALPAGTQYFKYGPTPDNPAPDWYVLPATFADNVVTYSLTDGGPGDDDLDANGVIDDPGGPGSAGAGEALPIPVMPPWMLAVLALLMLATAWLWRARPHAGHLRR